MNSGAFFHTNLQAFRQLDPDQAKSIESIAPQIEHRLYTVQTVSERYKNAQIPLKANETIPLYSSSNPADEINQWIDRLALHENAPHAILLIGFGLGYEAVQLIQQLPAHAVMAIVEPDPILFFTAFHHVDLSSLPASKRVYFYVGQSVEKAVEQIGAELEWSRFLSLPYKIAVSSLIQNAKTEFLNHFLITWRNAMQRELMYRRSRVEHGEQVVIHTIANAEAIARYPGVATLFHHFQGIPGVLVSAGPSLERNIKQLHYLQDRAMIACVNTAYPILRKHRIRPHIVFAMDHHERNLLSFEGESPSLDTFLIADPRINPAIVHLFPDRVFWASWRSTTETIGHPQTLDRIPVPAMSGNAIYLWLQSMLGSKGDVYGSGSVAVVGFHLLARLGCQPIILVGQDLAFTDEKVYASGTIFDNQALPQDAIAVHEVDSVDGGTLPTSDSLYLYRKLLEHEIARFGIPVFNASSGAVINGTITSRIDTLFDDLPNQRVHISSQLRMLQRSYKPRMDEIDLKRVFQLSIQQLQAFEERAKQGLEGYPPDPLSLSTPQMKTLLAQFEQAIHECTLDHQSAFDLLNELLQESHFDFEESRWRSMLLTDEKEIMLEKLRSNARVLDAFIRQANLLISQLEDKIHTLDQAF